MSELINLTLYNAQQGHTELMRGWQWAKAMLIAGHRVTMILKPETRSTPQNSRLWAMLAEISQQVDWHGRKFIGIEREPKYFDIACQRIEQAVAQGQLFAPEPIKQEQLEIL